MGQEIIFGLNNYNLKQMNRLVKYSNGKTGNYFKIKKKKKTETRPLMYISLISWFTDFTNGFLQL